MKYWWVNQKQTYRHEMLGGYLWSPKRNKNGAHNRAYDLMRTVTPGDLIFSFANGLIKAIGVVDSYCYEFPKPTEFGRIGDNWSNIGWRLDISYKEIINPIRPKDHIEGLRSLLPHKYSPLQTSGNGNQTFYLYDISDVFAHALANLMDRWIVDLVRGNAVLDLPKMDESLSNIENWEDKIEKSIVSDLHMPETEKETLVKARRGQGKFRADLLLIEHACRVTRVDNPTHLVASHTKPWRDCENDERLDPENGFMLTPTIDHLFDRGFISFENNGKLLISNSAHTESMHKLGLKYDSEINLGTFSEGQKHYLDWHRESILL
jgi:putative restriction endonuclease